MELNYFITVYFAYKFQFEIIDGRLGKLKVELERFTENYKQVEFYVTLDLTGPVTKTENIKTDATKILRPTLFSD